MRALLGLLCLISFTPDDQREAEYRSTRLERVAEYGTLISEIRRTRSTIAAQGLPDELREAVERWTENNSVG